MKNIDNKGFMVGEIIVVAVIIVIGLVGLFTTFTKTFIRYEKLNENTTKIDSVYAIKAFLKTTGVTMEQLEDSIELFKYNNYDSSMVKFTDLFNTYKIETIYLVLYDKTTFDNFINSLSDKPEFQSYVNNLKNELDFDDGSCKIISIIEMKDSSFGKYGFYKVEKD